MMELRALEAEFRARMHKALSFDATDDYVEVADSPSLDFSATNQITVGAWVVDNIGTDTIIRGIVFKDYEFQLRRTKSAEGNDFEFFIYDGKSWEPRVNSGVVPEVGRTYFVVGVFDGSKLDIYVNGILEGTRDRKVTINSTANPVLVGRVFVAGIWGGFISSVYIYNIALSKSEIKHLYYNPFDPPRIEHLVLWLAPGSIDTANGKWWDLSGKNNHGTIYGCNEVLLTEPEVVVL